MPYIKEEDREKWTEEELNKVANKIETHGELNYIVSRIIGKYLLAKGINYDNMDHISGTLDCIKTEFQRRVMSHYEEAKIASNGDIDEYADIKKQINCL